MSNSITNAMVQQFGDTFLHLSQQKESRLRSAVRIETGIVGTSKSINIMGKGSVHQRISRHSPTPRNDIAHTTRYLDLTDWHGSEWVDNMDKLKTLADPTNDYVVAIKREFDRQQDRLIVTALGGSARSNSGNIALPAGQKIAVGGTGLTKAKLIQARKIFRANECDQEAGEELYIGYTATQLSDLLSDTTLTNTEVNNVLDLMSGNFAGRTLMGFIPVPTELFAKSGSTRYIYAWAKSGLTLGEGQDKKFRIAEDPSNSFSTVIYADMSLGAVRSEDEKVVEIACNE
jgi:hypothetical protein